MKKIQIELTNDRLNVINQMWGKIDYEAFHKPMDAKVQANVHGLLADKLGKLAISKRHLPDNKKYKLKLEVFEAFYLLNAVVLTMYQFKDYELAVLNGLFNHLHQNLT